ncbi:hypothetical protein [Halobacterium zhouii]|uniref:hypothetical protein n=1 Tax=Halobacterium zhouii TaxID=2902624 RepID=UPI001E330765|nr:hypothetical protein [Halobacterium zhouii]
MATTGRTAEPTDADAASVLSSATFVRVTAAPTGGSLAAAAMLATACAERDVPYQVRVSRTPASDGPDATHVAIGFEASTTKSTDGAFDADAVLGSDAPNTAFETARELGGSPDPVLAFAGALADGVEPSSAVRDAANVERRPGVGIPTADLATGLAHSTRVVASFSGDEQAAGATLAELDLPAELDESARRRLASAVALDAVDDATAGTPGKATEHAADAVSAVLRPHVTSDGPFETAEGYADVLAALAWDAPGLGTAFALGNLGRSAALDAWRDHAVAAHRAVRSADLSRHRGVVTARVEDAQPTVARLLRDYRSPESAALVVGDRIAALATTDANARDVLGSADESPGGAGTRTLAVTEYDDEDALVSGVREAL